MQRNEYVLKNMFGSFFLAPVVGDSGDGLCSASQEYSLCLANTGENGAVEPCRHINEYRRQ